MGRQRLKFPVPYAFQDPDEPQHGKPKIYPFFRRNIPIKMMLHTKSATN
jgi:hypothetical protein